MSETMSFEDKLRDLINTESRENFSDTPDYILAEYLNRCLEAFESAVKNREVFYMVQEPGKGGG